MDIDAYTAAHRDEWERLAQLGKKGHFSGPEADELIDRYQSGAAQLSAIRSTAGSSVQGDRLSLYLSRARLRFTGAPANAFSRMPAFFLLSMPAALYRIRWLSIAVTLGCIAVATLYFFWAASDDRVLASFMAEADMKQIADEEFVAYYSNYAEGSFASLVWTNNARIAALCVAAGITGVLPLYLMYSNAQSIGIVAAIMDKYDKLDVFFLYIAPHGQLELYSIFVAGAAGLAIFWAIVRPGNLSRAASLAAGGRSLMTVAFALVLSLFLSGLIEGYVTRQDWPWPIKIGIGTTALVLFLAYQWVLGRRAHRLGETGDLDEFEAGARQLAAG